MQLLVFTGGFHPEMPFSEVGSLGFKETERDGRLVVGDIDDWKMLERLGYSHLVLRYLGQFEPGENFPFDPEKLTRGKFAARFKKLDFAGDFDEARQNIIDELDPYIDEVDLRNPDTTVYFFLKDEGIYAGELLLRFDPSEFFQRKSALRPYSQPISIPPRETRCWVNLSQVRDGEKLLDPFCGTGGILIEAGLIDCELYGSDIDEEMVTGTRMNLDYYGLEGMLKQCRIQELDEEWDLKFDAIVTDPPYGRSSKVGGEEVEKLYRESLQEMEKVLRDGKKCVLGAPKKLGLEKILTDIDARFELQEKFEEKVHGDLKREVFVLEKRT